jgi:hypothetical protein
MRYHPCMAAPRTRDPLLVFIQILILLVLVWIGSSISATARPVVDEGRFDGTELNASVRALDRVLARLDVGLGARSAPSTDAGAVPVRTAVSAVPHELVKELSEIGDLLRALANAAPPTPDSAPGVTDAAARAAREALYARLSAASEISAERDDQAPERRVQKEFRFLSKQAVAGRFGKPDDLDIGERLETWIYRIDEERRVGFQFYDRVVIHVIL